jgi:hypothetical protein
MPFLLPALHYCIIGDAAKISRWDVKTDNYVRLQPLAICLLPLSCKKCNSSFADRLVVFVCHMRLWDFLNVGLYFSWTDGVYCKVPNNFTKMHLNGMM